jgi:hypothetical protein
MLCGAALTVMGVWSARRRRHVLSWHRELDAAFADDDRRELPRGRVL